MAIHDKFCFLHNNRLCLFSWFLYARNILMPRNAHEKILDTFENQTWAFHKNNFFKLSYLWEKSQNFFHAAKMWLKFKQNIIYVIVRTPRRAIFKCRQNRFCGFVFSSTCDRQAAAASTVFVDRQHKVKKSASVELYYYVSQNHQYITWALVTINIAYLDIWKSLVSISIMKEFWTRSGLLRVLAPL